MKKTNYAQNSETGAKETGQKFIEIEYLLDEYWTHVNIDFRYGHLFFFTSFRLFYTPVSAIELIPKII